MTLGSFRTADRSSRTHASPMPCTSAGGGDILHISGKASAAAAEVLAMISKGTIEIEAATALVNERICSGCQICKLICPYSAILFDEEKGVCRVNDALCKGCGTCVSGCPSNSITLNHYTNEQIVAQMEGMLVQSGL